MSVSSGFHLLKGNYRGSAPFRRWDPLPVRRERFGMHRKVYSIFSVVAKGVASSSAIPHLGVWFFWSTRSTLAAHLGCRTGIARPTCTLLCLNFSFSFRSFQRGMCSLSSNYECHCHCGWLRTAAGACETSRGSEGYRSNRYRFVFRRAPLRLRDLPSFRKPGRLLTFLSSLH